MHILPVEPHHLETLSRLARATFTETFGHLYPPQDLSHFLEQSYGVERLRQDISDPAQFWRLAVSTDGQACAYLHCGPVTVPHPQADRDRHGEIKRLYVHSTSQGRGLGRRLMQIALEHLEGRYGSAPQWLGVYCDNLKAQALYAACGFERVGAYKFPVGQTLDDEFILRRQPTPSA